MSGLLSASSIAELRSAVTGEPTSRLFLGVQSTLANLSHAQQTQLAGVVADRVGGFSARLLGGMSPTVEQAVRSVVLPDAATPAQRELETAVLLALGRVHSYRRTDASGPRATPCTWVRPGSGDLALMLSPRVLAAVLAELVPRQHNGTLVGLAGLRVRQSRGHAELVLADTRPQAIVRVPRISHRQLAAAVAFSGAVTGSPDWHSELPDELADIEALFAAAGRVTGPTTLGSALLRRLGVLGDAERIAIETAGRCVRLDWAGGSSAAGVATLLTHPVVGLPDDDFATTMNPDGTIVLTCEGLRASLVLRRSEPAAPQLDHGLTIAGAWRMFEEVLVAPPDLTVVPPLAASSNATDGAADG